MKTKTCTKCDIKKILKEFNKDSSKNDGYYSSCKTCSDLIHKNYVLNNKKRIYLYKKEWRENNRKRLQEINKKRHKKFPWIRTLTAIKQRCENPNNPRYKYYGGRGIKCLITIEELKKLWFRDKAWLLVQPSIDRKENDDDYTLGNCQYIELEENIAKDKRKSVLQYDLDGNFIKKFKSQSEASRITGISQGNISSACFDKDYKTGKCKWRYK